MEIFSRCFSIKGKMPDYSSDCFFFRLQSSHWSVHFSYNSYLANLKYWRKSLRSSIFTSSKKLKGTKGYSLRVFSALWDFFSIFFHQKCPSFNFFDDLRQNGWKISPLVRQFGSTFGFFRYSRREYFDTLKSFCCFWPLDMAPTWAVPGLLIHLRSFIERRHISTCFKLYQEI